MGLLTQCDQEHIKGDGLAYGQGDALQRDDSFSASFSLSLISRKKAQAWILWALLSQKNKGSSVLLQLIKQTDINSPLKSYFAYP